jgi:hypothetical protein
MSHCIAAATGDRRWCLSVTSAGVLQSCLISRHNLWAAHLPAVCCTSTSTSTMATAWRRLFTPQTGAPATGVLCAMFWVQAAVCWGSGSHACLALHLCCPPAACCQPAIIPPSAGPALPCPLPARRVMCVSFHLKQEWGGQPFFPGTGALEETGEYQVGGYRGGGAVLQILLGKDTPCLAKLQQQTAMQPLCCPLSPWRSLSSVAPWVCFACPACPVACRARGTA